MRLHLPHPRRANMITYSLLLMSGLIFCATFLYSVNITVLKDWKLILPQCGNNTCAIHAGDNITVQSVYVKLRAVNGDATRYLECQNNRGVYIRYQLNQARADRAPGNTGTGIIFKLPTAVPDIPTTCRISINVTYPVYPWRRVTQFVATKTFVLLPEVSSPASALPNQTSQTLVVVGDSGTKVNASSGNNTPVIPTSPSTTLQPVSNNISNNSATLPEQTEPLKVADPPKPSLLDRVLHVVGL